MHVARLGVVAQHELVHLRLDLVDDVLERRRRGQARRGARVAPAAVGRGQVQRVVLVDLLRLGRGVVVDVDRVPRHHLRRPVHEGRARRDGGAGVVHPDAELVGRRVRVGLGRVVADRGDPHRLQRRDEVRVLLPGQLVGVLVGRRGPPGGLRGARGAGVGVGQFLLPGAGDAGGRGRGGITRAVVGQRRRRRGGQAADQRPARVGGLGPVDEVVGRVADRLPLQRHRPAGRHRERGGHERRGLVGARRVRPVELVGHRVLVGPGGQGPAGRCGVRVQVRRVDGARVARHQVGEAGVVARHEHLRVLIPQRERGVVALGQPQAARSRRGPRGGRDRAGVLVQLRLDVVLRRAAHVQVRRVVGVADPAEVVGVGLAGRRVGGLELRGQRVVRGRRARAAVVLQVAGLGRGAAAVVEQLVHPEAVRRRPLRRIGHVRGPHPQRVRVGVVDGVVGGVPRVIGGEGVVDVHLDVVAVQAQVRVLGHPVDQPGRQQQPLQLEGVVIKVQRQLGHPGLRVGARVLVYPGQHLPGRVGDQWRVGGPGVHRGPVAVGAGGERDRALELGEGGQPGRGQRPGGAVQGPSAHVGQAQGGGGVGIAVDLAHAERGLVGVQRGQLPGGEVRRVIGDDHAVEVAGGAAGQRGQRHRLARRRARRVDLGVGHPLRGQRGLPGRRRGIGRPVPDQQDLQVQRVRRGRRGRSTHRSQAQRRQHRGQDQPQPPRPPTPASSDRRPHRNSPPIPEDSCPPAPMLKRPASHAARGDPSGHTPN